jgi:lipopolysaccharide export system permease protein
LVIIFLFGTCDLVIGHLGLMYIDISGFAMLHYVMEILKKLRSQFNIYILKELIITLLISMGVLTFILVLSRLGKMADLVINKGVGFADILLLIVYSTPPYLTFTLPMAFLLSIIVVLGRLSSENEILALKSSGVDLKTLFIPIIVLGLFITFCGLLNTNMLLPKSGGLFRNTLINVIKKGISVDDKEGVFNDTIPGIVIYIDKVDTQKKFLSGVVISDDRDKEVKQTVSAKKGFMNINPDTLDLYFALENGNLHRWEKANDIYRTIAFDNYTFSMNLSSMIRYGGELRKLWYEMDRKELNKALASAKNDDERYDILLEIYKKITIPISPLAFIFLTIPLGVKRKIEGRFSGTLYSLLVFIFYYILMAFTENIGKAILLPAIITAFLPDIVIVAMGFFLLKHINEEEYATVSQKLRHFWMYCLEKIK